MQGIGYALMEELQVEDGRVTTPRFGDYKMPTLRDLPPLKTVLLESETATAPTTSAASAKRRARPVAPAIANAIADASASASATCRLRRKRLCGLPAAIEDPKPVRGQLTYEGKQ